MNVTTQDARPSGPEIRQQVFGAPTGKPTAPGGGDPFLRPFFETAIEHVWGGIWNRPGLELKYRSLVVARGRDDRGIDDRARLQQEAFRGQEVAHGGKDRGGEVVLLQAVPEPQDRGLVGHHVLAQLDARKPPHRLAVVDRVFGLGIREIEPLLEEVDPQHLLEPQGLAALPGLRIVGRDHGEQLLPGDHAVHLGQELLSAGHFDPSGSRPARRTSAVCP
jgi:hypothetical protein